MDCIYRTSFNCMNYLFLSHVTNDGSIVANDTVEGELFSFLCSIAESKIVSSEMLTSFKSVIIEEMKYWDFKNMSIKEIEREIKNSIYIILGHESSTVFEIYKECLHEALFVTV